MKWHEIDDTNRNERRFLTPENKALLTKQGFDCENILYHGTKADFELFDAKRLRTADHFYTAPDPDTARYYGDTIYTCVGIQDPQADLIEDYELLGKLADTFASEHYDDVESDEDLQALKQELIDRWVEANPDGEHWDAEDAATESDAYKKKLHAVARAYFIEQLETGQTYGMYGRRQNQLMNECFAMGYRSVRFHDPSTTGMSVSVVFKHGSDIVIIGKFEE